MKVKPSDLTVAQVREYLTYDADTGHLTWIKRPSSKIFVGERAGSLVTTTGYRSIQFLGCSYREHRLIWFLVYGYWADIVDHIDHKRDNNKLSNLRDVTYSENSRNISSRKDTITGEQGIWWCKRRLKWVAEITHNRKKVFQRTFDSIADARVQRAEALLKLGFHENHGT